jgi:hypothetical protein
MRLESRLTGRRLDSKERSAERRARYVETWRHTWETTLEGVIQDYDKYEEEMDAEARFPFDEHKKQMTALIKSQDWEQDEKLCYFLEQLEEGRWLTLWQESHLTHRVKEGSRERTRKRRNPVPKVQKGDVIQALSRLNEKATLRSDGWTLRFSQSIRDRVKDNKGLSKRQREKLTEKCEEYGVSLPTLV